MISNTSRSPGGAGLGEPSVRWGWMLALGILMLVLGVVGLGMSYWLTFVAVFWFGVLAIIGGVGQILDAFHHKRWKGIVWHVIIGIVYIVAGLVLINTPVSAAFWMTLFIAISLVVTGVMRIFIAFQVRDQGSGWFWVLLTGLLSIVLGFLVWGMITPPGAEALVTPEGQLAWIRSWGWVIGMFVAFELIMAGISLLSVALATRSNKPSRALGERPVAMPGG